jgi:hypothetical protein
MKTIFNFPNSIFLFLLCMMSSSAVLADKPAPVRTTTEMALPPFHSLVIQGDVKLYIQLQPENSLRADYLSTAAEDFSAEVKDGVLYITMLKAVNRFDMPRVDLSCSGFQDLRANGNFYIKMEDALPVENFSVDVKGGGLLNLNLEVNRLRVSMEGQVVASIKGHADDARIELQQESYCAALHLDVRRMFISAQGMSKAEVVGREEVIAVAGQNGSIRCGGTAELKSSVQGMGSVEKLPSL